MEHIVRIFVPPMGVCNGKPTWENTAEQMKRRLIQRLNMDIRFEIVYLFSPEFFSFPDIAEQMKQGDIQPPIVTVDGQVISSGGKLREREIREELLFM